jgi:pyruvate dehydrogenase E2 component (dihydrolipoamide acetyltransferase)
VAKEFRLPDIGEGIAEGEVVKWLVEEGQEVKEDQPMVEVMTDKATVEIPSPYGGVVLRRLAQEGETVKVGQVLIVIGEKGEAAGEPSPTKGATPLKARTEKRQAPVRPAEVPEVTPGRALAAPAVRKLAREMGVNLAQVRGSGAGGRVTEDDVRAFAAAGAPAPAVERPAAPAPAADGRPGDKRIPVKGLRKKIWENMVRSEAHAVPFTYVDEVDVTELVKVREKGKAQAERQGVNLTYLPFIVKAVVAALREHPTLNALVDEEKQELVVRGEYNIGIATATEDGLTVPVVHGADRRSIMELAKEIDYLAERARQGKMELKDLQGGTFTITSLGAQGGLLATPIIYHPQVAILGVHEIKRRPVVDEGGNVVVRDIMNLSCTFDHRLIDGHVGASFLKGVAHCLTHPALLLLHGG